jgi:hypothetical protein
MLGTTTAFPPALVMRSFISVARRLAKEMTRIPSKSMDMIYLNKIKPLQGGHILRNRHSHIKVTVIPAKAFIENRTV